MEERPRAIVAEERVVDRLGGDASRRAAGSRPVSAFDRQMMSGVTRACSQANIRPVRPKPVSTSSAISSTPWRSHSRRTPARNPPARRSCRPRPAASARRARPPPSLRSSRSSVLLEVAQAVDAAASRGRGRADSGSSTARARAIDVETAAARTARVNTESSLDRHRADRVAVIGVVQRHERAGAAAAPRLRQYWHGQLQRDFDGRGSVVGIEHARQAGAAAARRSRSARSTAGCVRAAGEDRRARAVAAWSASASFSRGCEWPWMFTHHDEMPSSMRRPSSV